MIFSWTGSIPINPDDEDSWYWRHDRFGTYTVKSAYSLLQSSNLTSASFGNSEFWRRLWNLKIPPKTKNFLWSAARECLPTKSQLRMKHLDVDPSCPFCQKEIETIPHILVSCEFSARVWHLSGLGVSTSAPASFSTWLDAEFDKSLEEQMTLIAMVSSAIWHCRNQLVWNQRHLAAPEVVRLAKSVLGQWASAQDRTADLSLGNLQPEDGASRWCAPKEGVLKINTDASLFNDHNCFSFCCVARDHLSSFIEAVTICRRGQVTPEVAEALGIKEALG